jgi:putative inorganic carbon (hco3(-)) transporter
MQLIFWIKKHWNIYANPWKGQWLGLLGLVIGIFYTWLPDSYFKMVTWPWLILWQIGFLSLGLWHFWTLRQFQYPWQRLGYGLDRPIVALVLVVILSSIAASFREVALWNSLLFLAYISVFYLLRNCLGSPKIQTQLLWRSLVIVTGIASIIALVCWQPNPDMWLSNNFETAIRNRFPLGHHNFSGGYFALTLPVAVTFAIAHRHWQRWLGVATSLSIAAALYSSGSRGAWLGASVSLLFCLGLSLWNAQGQQRRRLLLGSVGVVCLLILVFLSNPRMRTLFAIQQTDRAGQSAQVVLTDYPTLDRLYMARSAINIVRDAPWLGVGPGNMARVYNLYRPINAGTGLELVQQLHNTPLQIMSEIGIVGFAAYGWFLAQVARLWFRIKSCLNAGKERWLLYGIGASALSYGCSSLTDYQLENIPIAGTLIALLLLLISLADQGLVPNVNFPLTQLQRRLYSMVLLGLLGLQMSLWITFDISSYLSRSAIAYDQENNFVAADSRWFKASYITPWDPTPSALAAQLMVSLRDEIQNSKDYQSLTQQTINYYLKILETAPNDAWFNNNLAVLYLDSSPQKAEAYAINALLLYPRASNYNYFLLGESYLKQNKLDAATVAFALEILSTPNMITMALWNQAPYAALLPKVQDLALQYYDRLLASLPSDQIFYNAVYEQSLMVRWWCERMPSQIEWTRLRPIVQATLRAETEPNEALKIANQEIAANNNQAARLLRAWIEPTQYLENYLNSESLTPEETALIKVNILNERSLKQWFTSTLTVPPERKRYALALAYRNGDANSITDMLRPGSLEYSAIANQVLNLFSGMPRDLPELDQLMETIRETQLNLIHPTRQGYKLPTIQ